jgi:predicted membrane protein
MERVSKSLFLKIALWIFFACSLVLNILLGYMVYKYSVLYNEFKNNKTEESVSENVPSNSINPFQNNTEQLKISGNQIKILDEDETVKNTVSIDLKEGETIGDVSISNKNDRLAVITIQNANSDNVVTRLLLISISDNKVLRQIQTDDGYECAGEKSSFEIFQSSIWGNDDEVLYISYSAGGSGEKTLGLDTNTYNVSVDGCYGGIIGIMPSKDSILNAYYTEYGGDLLLVSHHYFVIGGGPYEISIVDSKTCQVEDENILEYSDNTNVDLETFYNILNINL